MRQAADEDVEGILRSASAVARLVEVGATEAQLWQRHSEL